MLLRAEAGDKVTHQQPQDGENEGHEELTDDGGPEANRVVKPLDKDGTKLL